jgi:hypothetical protein
MNGGAARSPPFKKSTNFFSGDFLCSESLDGSNCRGKTCKEKRAKNSYDFSYDFSTRVPKSPLARLIRPFA